MSQHLLLFVGGIVVPGGSLVGVHGWGSLVGVHEGSIVVVGGAWVGEWVDGRTAWHWKLGVVVGVDLGRKGRVGAGGEALGAG